MSAQRNSDQIIHAFFQDGVDEMPDRSFDAVRTAIDQTRQWAVVGPWKEPQIMTATRFALIAAAIAVLAVVAIRFLPSTTIGPAPTPSPSPTASPSPLSLPQIDTGPIPVAAGAYAVPSPFPVPVTFTLPSAWKGNVGGGDAVFLESAAGNNFVSFTFNQTLYADACHFRAGFASPRPGPAADDFATALTKIGGLTTAGPTDESIGGLNGKLVTLNSPTDTSGCDLTPDGTFRIWTLPYGATEDIGPGWTDRLWVVDTGGHRLVIQASGPTSQSDAEKAAVQSVVDSIVIKH
jgi:hypothetical protein